MLNLSITIGKNTGKDLVVINILYIFVLNIKLRTMKVDLSKKDIINLLKSVRPNSTHKCQRYEKEGFMRFVGNQHNSNSAGM